MSIEKNFKGFSLDENGCVQGAYPCFSSVIESQVNKISELENEYVMKIFRNLHIDTDVLTKQKAEIDRLSFENEQLICNNTDLKQSLDWANEREVEWANRVEELKTDLEYAKAVIKDLLNNSHEYSRQNAEDFIKEKK